jgi:hypothetical protein
MKLSQNELNHVIFLSEVVLDDHKRALMPETIECLLHIVKALPDCDLLDDTADEIQDLISKIEAQLKTENDRLQEIRQNLTTSGRRKPL